MKKENTVIKEVPFITSPLEGEDACKAGEGVIHTVSPSFVLRTFSPSRGEINQGSIARGFTLIELLVVVLIIGILAAVAVPQYQKAVEKAHIAQVLPMIRAIGNAQEVYYLANGKYADSIQDLDINITIPNETWEFDMTNQKVYFYRKNKNYDLNLYFLHTESKVGDIVLSGKIYCAALQSIKQAVDICKTAGKESASDATNARYFI